MECQDTIRALKINFKKNISTVVLVVEGADYEFELFKKIFRNILHYKLVTKSRNQSDFKEYNEFIMKGNEFSKVIIINTKNSNIGYIEDDDSYRNELYKLLYEKYDLDIKNIPVYYIWDRDKYSNDKAVVRKLLLKLINPYENDEFENGLLLLSYPCCEAYTISCFEKDKLYITDEIKDKKYKISMLDRYKVQNAVLEMIRSLKKLGINEFDIDKVDEINVSAFDSEEKIFDEKNRYLLLSFISVIFLDLGIITFK